VEEAPALKVTPFLFLKKKTSLITTGWGVYLPYSLTGLNIVNDAIAGRSARSYTVEGRFTTLINSVVSGDFVIIEFGHNDGGSLSPTDNGRSDCVGAGAQVSSSHHLNPALISYSPIP